MEFPTNIFLGNFDTDGNLLYTNFEENNETIVLAKFV